MCFAKKVNKVSVCTTRGFDGGAKFALQIDAIKRTMRRESRGKWTKMMVMTVIKSDNTWNCCLYACDLWVNLCCTALNCQVR